MRARSLFGCRYVGDATSRSGDDGYVSQGAFGKQSRLSKQKHQITAVAMDLMLNEKEILAVCAVPVVLFCMSRQCG